MRFLVTGATGFLGRYVVATAMQRGHSVRALVRPATSLPREWTGAAAPETVRVDLRNPEGLVDALRDVDVVLHLAAAKAGDLHAQLAGTVVATDNLIAAMGEAGVERMVLTSTFSVYDWLGMSAFTVVDEASPLEPRPASRDAYCQTKLMQERRVREAEAKGLLRAAIVRPGAIYGPGETWTARLGSKLSDKLWVRTGAWARLPLVHVESCADLVVLCAEREEALGEVFVAVADALPTQRRYLGALARHTRPRPRLIRIPWTVMRCIARFGWFVNRIFLKGRAKVPQILSPASLHARCKPFRYSNEKAKRVLGWKPRYGFPEGLDRCFTHVEVPSGAPVETDGASR